MDVEEGSDAFQALERTCEMLLDEDTRNLGVFRGLKSDQILRLYVSKSGLKFFETCRKVSKEIGRAPFLRGMCLKSSKYVNKVHSLGILIHM